MLIGKQSVLDYINLTKAKHFRVYRGGPGGNRRVPTFFYEEAGGTEVCKTQFSAWADINSYSNPIEYSITVYPKGKPTGSARDEANEEGGTSRDTLNESFYLVPPNGQIIPSPNAMAPQALGAASMKTHEEMVKQIREEIEKEYEMEDLYEEIDEIKASQSKFYNELSKIVGLLSPALSGLIGDGMAAMGTAIPQQNQPFRTTTNVPPRAQHLAGIDPDPTEVLRLNGAVKRLRANDPLIADHLEKLAEISETKPATFKQLLMMLDNGI